MSRKQYNQRSKGNPKQQDTTSDILFRKMLFCSMEKKERSYGVKTLLKMKMMEIGIDSDINERWAKPSLQSLRKSGFANKGKRKDFKDFQLEKFLELIRIQQKSNQIQYGRIPESATRDYSCVTNHISTGSIPVQINSILGSTQPQKRCGLPCSITQELSRKFEVIFLEKSQ
ncbi:unnamed protein product [Paramecium octaurelia]|uniref:Uncharacterized protein n=1 Tax=Paramecium octaurelia TaxID=43137 RepID=A0A8S1WTK2_PAROT|nr:unnamed protein product [Paramecium octaurelia]